MKDLTKIYKECVDDLNNYGVSSAHINPKLIVNKRAKKRWGQADWGKSTISISSRLLEDDVDDFGARNCMMHELLHLLTPGSGHTGEWKTLAALVNKKSNGKYAIKRTASAEEYGVSLPKVDHKAKYILQCEKCGVQVKRERMSEFVKHPSGYSHKGCNGRFKRVV